MDLREAINNESNRLSNLLLGFSAAAIAFAAHEIGSWPASRSAILAGGALAIWAGSFIAGLARGHAIYDVMRWNGALNATRPDDPRHTSFKRNFDRSNLRAGKSYMLQRWLLIGGALVFGAAEGLKLWETRNEANDRRCLALQHDILSAAPKKTNGIDLFEAFGCKPQGEGSVMVPRR